MIDIITMFNIGFSLVVSVILFVIYLLFIKDVPKTLLGMGSCFALLAGLMGLQFQHYGYLAASTEPLDSLFYRFLLFLVPPMFYLFSRETLFPAAQLRWVYLAHLLPIPLVFFVEKNIATPLAFLIGACYCFWLLSVVYRLRSQQKRYRVELFFFGFFAALALVVLIFGFSISYIQTDYFYYFYANGIAVTYMLVTGALIVYPNLLAELNEVVNLGYTNSTLANIDTSASLRRLDQLMLESKIFQNEDLNLSLLSEAMMLSSHQLSELINTNHGMSFSQFIRRHRIDEAKRILASDTTSSILSISMELGFKSQSNFYSAFKEIAGVSPGQFRKDAS